MTHDSANPASCVLVTGAAGFIGRHLVAALLEKGYRVIALQHRMPLPPNLSGRCERLVAGNICDPKIQCEALRDVDIICHLSAYIPAVPNNDLKEAVLCYQINAQTTLELATAASQNGIRRFIHLSTGNMYAPSDKPCVEADSLFPDGYATGYFASKLAAELYLSQLGKQTGMEVLILRIGTPYGPGEPHLKVIPNFLQLAAQGQALRVANGGEAKYNFVYVTDVADCIVRAIENGPGGAYNVASGEHTSVRELTHLIVRLFSEREVPLHVEPVMLGSFPGFPALSIKKAQHTWRFAPRSLASGLEDYRATLAKDDLIL